MTGMAKPKMAKKREAPAPSPLVDDERITAFGMLLEAHARLVRLLGRSLQQECQVPSAWFEVLLRLARSPDRKLTMGTLAEQLALTTGGVTRLVDRMEAAGYVARKACPTDRRVQHLTVTPAGLAKLDEAARVHVRNLDEHFIGRLSQGELATLVRAMDKLRRPAP